MSQEERFGTRDRSYSAWHRRFSTRRFVGIERAQTLSMIDLDAALYVEYDDESREPIALVETALDRGGDKTATVTANLARRAGLEAYIVLYTLDETDNPADRACKDIRGFRVRQIWPKASGWRRITPAAWAKCLVNIRERGSALLDKEWAEQNEVSA